MIRIRTLMFAAVTSLGILGAATYAADDQSKTDQEVATEYTSEAKVLAEKAASHRKLAKLYRNRTPHKGAGSFDNVARHCDTLADLYEQAAKEAQAVADELTR